MKKPLVSITIPTFNSKKTIQLCLKAVKSQTYKPIEIILMDSGSTDGTRDIAKQEHVSMISVNGGLLKSRIIGINKTKGEFILLLDSDQILEKDTIERAVYKCTTVNYDMLALGEDVYEKKTLIQYLFAADRKIIEQAKDYNPYTSAILPRFFRKSLLLKAITSIPHSIVDTVGGPDHAILYYESWLLTKKITTLGHAVKHMESDSIRSVIKKCYRWGYTGETAKTETKYYKLMSSKERFRKGLFHKGLYAESIGSLLLLLIKGIPYKIGYYKAIIDRYKNRSYV